MKIGYDNNSDNDIADAGDDIQVDDSFGSNVLSLSYDNNGNLSDDAVYKFVYDAWNRLAETKRRVDAETSVATYAFLGDNRRAKKVVQNCGTEHLAGDGGNTTVHYYYCGTGFQPVNWNIVETRNGSNQATAQYVWGTQYTDELVMVDINGDATESNDCNPDDQGGESPADARYFYHQDRQPLTRGGSRREPVRGANVGRRPTPRVKGNWNVVALSEYDTGGSNNGRIVERYSYTPYGQFVVLKGDSGSGELGNLQPTSTVGNPFAHQGLPIDHEKASYQNRHREYTAELQRFAQRDPADYDDGANLYARVGGRPTAGTDHGGLAATYLFRAPPRCIRRTAGPLNPEPPNLFPTFNSCVNSRICVRTGGSPFCIEITPGGQAKAFDCAYCTGGCIPSERCAKIAKTHSDGVTVSECDCV
ncbi:MAG TPA: RHS repeat-associated core domain-containing protein [Phycisphaerae bacterium]|nr:RHS repeat-associated core domain-containing protein [Phycisphaerae bacterium]